MKEVVNLSASQIKAHERCERRWAFRAIEKIEEPPKKDAEFGVETHATLENYLDTGAWTGALDCIAVAKQGVKHLPKPSTNLLIEHSFTMPVLSGRALLRGVVDVIVPPKNGELLHIIDHKTTKNLRYAMGADELDRDTQKTIYVQYALTEFEQTEVRASWLYYCAGVGRGPSKRPREPKGFRPVSAVYTHESNKDAWDNVLDRASLMTEQKLSVVRANELSPNRAACSDFGGCPYITNCEGQRSTLQTAFLGSGTKTMATKSFKEILAERKARQNAVTPAPVEDAAPTPVEEETPTPVEDAAPIAEKPKRKRRTKAEMAAAIAEAFSDDVPEVPEVPEVPITPKAIVVGKVTKPKGYTLLVNTGFLKSIPDGVTHVTALTAALKERIETDNEVPYWNSLSFRQGEVLLAQHLRDALVSNNPTGYIMAERESVEWKACGSVLIEFAEKVLEGR